MDDIRPFHLHTPTPIEFGIGVAAKVGKRASSLGMRHALLVTDAGLARSPAFDAARASLEAAGVAATAYTEVVLDPTADSISHAVAAYRATGADGLVALGGGSAMDTAKALGVLAVAGGDDIVPYTFGGSGVIQGIPPLICMPTTAGTGAEITFVAIVTHDEQQKKLLRDARLAPALALVDPALTASMPPHLTAYTGMDALSHALEALTSTLANPISDALALDAIWRINRALPQAVAQGDDLEARADMSLAAMVAGMAFLNGRVHLGHAVGHSFGTHFKLAHGLACIVCMPAILEFVRPACAPALARMAAAFGHDDAVAAVGELMEATAIPRLGAAANLTSSDIPRLVEIVQTEERLIQLSRRQPTAAQWGEIFGASL
ncbi:MAG: iron-containing alcohol dehydrogenase [Chloroflexaceae bacterium]|jgi:alcohol dehydrogenase|nr:iron-containing alcohol dehydrogenase [Chloroflexaceae bacterium]